MKETHLARILVRQTVVAGVARMTYTRRRVSVRGWLGTQRRRACSTTMAVSGSGGLAYGDSEPFRFVALWYWFAYSHNCVMYTHKTGMNIRVSDPRRTRYLPTRLCACGYTMGVGVGGGGAGGPAVCGAAAACTQKTKQTIKKKVIVPCKNRTADLLDKRLQP